MNEANPQNLVASFNILPLLEVSHNSNSLAGYPFKKGLHLSQLFAPSLIAVLVLLLACFNFVNTNIAYSSRRLKEIGVRKVIGCKRSQLIIQYMGENLILSSIALALGLFLAEPFLKFYDGLFPFHEFTLNYFENPIILFISITFITA